MKVVLLISIFLVISCSKEVRPIQLQSSTEPQYELNLEEKTTSQSINQDDDFSDLKKNDKGACDSAKNIKLDPNKAATLQGGENTGCKVD
jgi:hypothetical protein